jgi:hypothetical protein
VRYSIRRVDFLRCELSPEREQRQIWPLDPITFISFIFLYYLSHTLSWCLAEITLEEEQLRCLHGRQSTLFNQLFIFWLAPFLRIGGRCRLWWDEWLFLSSYLMVICDCYLHLYQQNKNRFSQNKILQFSQLFNHHRYIYFFYFFLCLSSPKSMILKNLP